MAVESTRHAEWQRDTYATQHARESGEPQRILIVDDDQSIRETLRFVFEDAGYDTSQAADGIDALAILRNTQEPLIVVLDMMMPRLDGEGVLRAVAAEPDLATRHCFVLITANMQRFSRPFSDLLRTLAVSVVRKPFDLDVLLDVVERCRERRESVDYSAGLMRSASSGSL